MDNWVGVDLVGIFESQLVETSLGQDAVNLGMTR